MKKAKRFETQKDIELHAKFTKKKLLCHGGLKLKSFCMMCQRISESDWKGCRNQDEATLTIGKQILKATGMEDELKKRVCPADCILFSYGVEFGTKKIFRQTILPALQHGEIVWEKVHRHHSRTVGALWRRHRLGVGFIKRNRNDD